MESDGQNKKYVPNWASILGVVAIMLGVFLTGLHGTEAMKQSVIATHMPAEGQPMPEADCPEGELAEEGITVAECEFLVDRVEGFAMAMPDGFANNFMWLAVIGTILAFASVIIGGALVNYTSWASSAAIAVFAGLALVDILQFMMVVGTGPVIREMYLWNILLWLILHSMLLVGALAGRHTEAEKSQ